MSQENVEAMKRGLDAYNRRDVEALLEELDPEVEWHPALLVPLEGEPTVYRGHEGIREFFRDVDDVLAEIEGEYSEIRDLGNRVVGIGRLRMRGRGSGAETESPLANVTDFENGKVRRIRTYLDPGEALKAAGLEE
jgi:ketosteroid isomerase-like protein